MAGLEWHCRKAERRIAAPGTSVEVRSLPVEDKLGFVQGWDMRAALADTEVSHRCSRQRLLEAGKNPSRQRHNAACERLSSYGVEKAILLRQ
jgi:hypothetical protein